MQPAETDAIVFKEISKLERGGKPGSSHSVPIRIKTLTKNIYPPHFFKNNSPRAPIDVNSIANIPKLAIKACISVFGCEYHHCIYDCISIGNIVG